MNCVHCHKDISNESPSMCHWHNDKRTNCPSYALCETCGEDDDIDDKYFVDTEFITVCRPCYEHGEKLIQEHRAEIKTRTIQKIIKEVNSYNSYYLVKFKGIEEPSMEKVEDLRECENFDVEEKKHHEIMKGLRLKEEQKIMSRITQQQYWLAKLSLGENIIRM